MKITGGCFCDAIRYEADIDENRVGICHCRDCQIFSGSSYRLAAFVPQSKFSFAQGSPRYFDKTADSGNVRRMGFCDQCGTHLCSLPPDSADENAFVSVRIATSDAFDRLTPSAEVFCDSRVPWLAPIEGMRQFPRMP